MSLKRHPNVVFVGIDTLDDIMNNSYNELFVSGGCIISHEFVLDPDFITRGRLTRQLSPSLMSSRVHLCSANILFLLADRLTALLVLLERLSSQESLWKWKIHCKTHKKLKEQSRY